MKLRASIHREPAGISKQGEPYEAFVTVRGTVEDIKDKSFEFSVNGAEKVDQLTSVAQAFKAARVAPIIEITGGVVDARPQMTRGDGVRRPAEWAGMPIHAITGKIVYNIVGKYDLPDAEPVPDLLMNATAILDA